MIVFAVAARKIVKRRKYAEALTVAPAHAFQRGASFRWRSKQFGQITTRFQHLPTHNCPLRQLSPPLLLLDRDGLIVAHCDTTQILPTNFWLTGCVRRPRTLNSALTDVLRTEFTTRGTERDWPTQILAMTSPDTLD
jgi:hypothetical protein